MLSDLAVPCHSSGPTLNPAPQPILLYFSLIFLLVCIFTLIYFSALAESHLRTRRIGEDQRSELMSAVPSRAKRGLHASGNAATFVTLCSTSSSRAPLSQRTVQSDDADRTNGILAVRG